MTLNSVSNLEGLAGLARTSGVDIRPTLLRVLTDLYVQKPIHSPDEQRHYTELALRLIDVVDAGTRSQIAERLAGYAGAPHAVVLRLARDVPVVATPILQQSQELTQSELLSIVNDFGSAHASVIAGRDEFARGSATASRPRRVQPAAQPAELSELFFAADAAERRLILLNLDYAAIAAADPVHPSRAGDAIRNLETAALSRDIQGFATTLKDTLGITHPQALRIARDHSGEPILVAAKALAMPAAVLQRIVLFLNPIVGESVQRVYGLARLYDELTEGAALRMLSIWRAAVAVRTGRHQPVHHDDERSNARTAASPHRYSARFADSGETPGQRKPHRAS